MAVIHTTLIKATDGSSKTRATFRSEGILAAIKQDENTILELSDGNSFLIEEPYGEFVEKYFD